MNVLIVGANGYTGSYLSRAYIKDQHSVSVLLSKSGSVSNLSSMISQGLSVLGSLDSWSVDTNIRMDGVISLVGHAIKDHLYGDIDALVSAQLTAHTQALEIGRQLNCPVVIAGSYSETIRTLNHSSLNLYSLLTASMASVAEFFHKEYGVPTCRILLADTYGPHDWRNKLIPTLLNSSENSEPHLLGSPNQVMVPIFISDVIAGLQMALTSLQEEGDSHSTYQLFPNTVLKVSDVVKNVERILGRQILINWNGRSLARHEVEHIDRSFLPPSGWTQRVSFTQGLALSASSSNPQFDELE